MEKTKEDTVEVKSPQVTIIVLTEREIGAWEQWMRDHSPLNHHPAIARIGDLAIAGLRAEIKRVKDESGMNKRDEQSAAADRSEK